MAQYNIIWSPVFIKNVKAFYSWNVNTVIRSSLLATSCSMLLCLTSHLLISDSNSLTLSAQSFTCCLSYRGRERKKCGEWKQKEFEQFCVQTFQTVHIEKHYSGTVSDYWCRQAIILKTKPPHFLPHMIVAGVCTSSYQSVALLQQCLLLSSWIQIPLKSLTVHIVHFQSSFCLQGQTGNINVTRNRKTHRIGLNRIESWRCKVKRLGNGVPVPPVTGGLLFLLQTTSNFLQVLPPGRITYK